MKKYKMNIEEAIKLLKQEPDFSLSYYKREYAIDVLLADYEKQQKEIEELKVITREYEAYELGEGNKIMIASKEWFADGFFKNFLSNYISKDKIKEKIEEITSYAYASVAERDCQDYAIQVLKELLGE